MIRVFLSVFELSAKKLRIEVVGFGKMGMLHAGVVNALPEAQLMAVCEKMV